MKLLAAILLLIVGFGLGFLLGHYGISPHTQTKGAPQQLDLNITDGGEYRVRKVIDGDTIVLENGIHVRYHGVNAPEMGRYVKDPAPLGREATARNIELVEGKRVRLLLPREPLDIHGRVLARVLVLRDGEAPLDTAEVLIKEGLARPMGLGLTAEEQRQAKIWEEQAQQEKLGLWAEREETSESAALKPYCAASGSTTFHYSTCATARRIRGINLHQYDNAAEAAAAGLKPCSKCNPK